MYPGALSNNTWYRYLAAARPHPSGRFMYMTNCSAWDMFAYDFETGEIYSVGRTRPKDGYFPQYDELGYSVTAFCIDKDGVLWYEQTCSITNYHGELIRLPSYRSRLFRWDIENGKEPECLGILAVPGRMRGICVEMEYDEVNDRIYTVDHGQGFGAKGPCALCIDLAEFRRHMYEPGPIFAGDGVRPRQITREEADRAEARRKSGAGEEVTEANPFLAFPIGGADRLGTVHVIDL